MTASGETPYSGALRPPPSIPALALAAAGLAAMPWHTPGSPAAARSTKAVAPHRLYLGCRIAWGRDVVYEECARYADVVSVNAYGTSVVW